MGVLTLSSIQPSASAVDLYRQGRLSECLERLGGGPADTLLRAKVLLHLARPSEVVRMDVLNTLADVPNEYKYLAQSLLAFAFLQVKMLPQAYTTLASAYDNLAYAKAVNARDQVDYVAAFDKWMQGDYGASETLLRGISTRGGVSGARALALWSFIEASREHYDKQIALLKRAWETLPLMEDVYVGAKILHSLAYLSCELYDPELAAYVERAADRMPWTSDLVHEQIETMRSIAWNHALAGDLVWAIRQFRRNESIATTDETKLVALLDRGRISNGNGEITHFRMYIDAALELSGKIRWGQTIGDERFCLLSLAALTASMDANRARGILEQYGNITTPVSPAVAFGNTDKRRSAAEQYAAGVVARYLGEREAAMTHLRESFRMYKSIKHHWRAALCAYHLDAIGGDQAITECALIWIREEFPHAWFRPLFEQSERLETMPAYQQLTKIQRGILRLLIQGKSAEEIARQLDRVEQTVRNHTTAIYKAFGVHKQTDLIKICTDRRRH